MKLLIQRGAIGIKKSDEASWKRDRRNFTIDLGDGFMGHGFMKDIILKDKLVHTYNNDEREDPIMIGVIDELGERANSRYSRLKVVEIPDGTEYEIAEYDGNEHIAERHETWS